MVSFQQPEPGRGPLPEEPSPWALAGLGVQFCVSLVLFVYAGGWLDRRFDTAPVFLLSGLFVGGGGSFYASYRRLTRPSRPRAGPGTSSVPKP